MTRTLLCTAQKLVVKVGSALVTNDGKGLDRAAMAKWAAQIAHIRKSGKSIVLVSSGAIAAGIQTLGWASRPSEMSRLQAAAAVGQMNLIQAYEGIFAEHGLITAQILLTHEDLSDRQRYLNARATLNTLLELGVVPIINENDTIVTDEIKFGDNDTLGALVANLIEADALVILTDQQGLYSADPRQDPTASIIHEGRADDKQYEAMAGGAGSGISKGGMITKIRAAQRAARSGAHTLIASGRENAVLERLLKGETLGTFLYAQNTPLQARKQWLADHLQVAGKLILDDGAVAALHQGKSLLPIGVSQVQGQFERGAVLGCYSQNGQHIASGLTNYSSQDAERIMRHDSKAIEAILGHESDAELIHRNNLVLIQG